MITVTCTEQPTDYPKEVDAELAKFDAWFQKLGYEPLVKSEVAIVKAYVMYALTNSQTNTGS